MNNDLISRDDLKKAFEAVYPLSTNEMGGVVNKRIYDIIDNAPTVKFSLMPADETKEDTYKRGYERGKIAGILEANTRPQGEWIVSQTMDCHSDIVSVYICPFCGKKAYSAYPFCHCGADMRGDPE